MFIVYIASKSPFMVKQEYDDDDDLFENTNSPFNKIVKMTQQWSSLPKKIHLLFSLWIHLQVNARHRTSPRPPP